MRSICLVVILAGPGAMLMRADVAFASQTVRASASLRTARGQAHARPEPRRPSSVEVAAMPWSQFRKPTSGLPQVIGGYAAGCIDGAMPLPLIGDGFRVVHPERNRVFGHPDLIGVIRDLGARLSELGLATLSIGDLGQPRGGPTPSGHASHQTGLDVDIWFVPPWLGRPLSMVVDRRQASSPLFDDEIVTVLELAASDPRVERIFINPVLKRAICERSSGFDRIWVRKLRPWSGHDDHFHVRVACPADSPTCVEQEPLPPGDGCDQLGVWLRRQKASEHSRARARTNAASTARAPSTRNELPDGCRALVDPSPPRVPLSARTHAAR